MQEYLSQGQQGAANPANLKNIFAEHKNIFNQYANLNIPKHLLKQMIKELQEYHSQIISFENNHPVQPSL